MKKKETGKKKISDTSKTFTEFKESFRANYGRNPTIGETWIAAKRETLKHLHNTHVINPIRCRTCCNDKCELISIDGCHYEPRYVPV